MSERSQLNSDLWIDNHLFYNQVLALERHKAWMQVKDAISFFALLRLTVPYIPESNQLSWQKAAGMYHVCLNFVSKYEPETEYLVKWLNSLSLDLRSHRTLLQFNPTEMIVRGSLEFGVPAILAISFNPKVFRDNKRIMQLIILNTQHIVTKDSSRFV